MFSEDDGKPIAQIETVEPEETQSRPLGLYKGMFEVGPEFFEPLPEDELRLWNCEGDDEVILPEAIDRASYLS